MTSTVEKTGRGLISEQLFGLLVDRIVAAEEVPAELAARMVDQALAFLCACGRDVALTPSAPVDIGRHAFILNTREYTEFCRRVAGRFIHHVPDGAGRKVSGARRRAELARTIEAISSAGFAVDPELWLAAGACSDGDDGCRASGKDGNENSETNGR